MKSSLCKYLRVGFGIASLLLSALWIGIGTYCRPLYRLLTQVELVVIKTFAFFDRTSKEKYQQPLDFVRWTQLYEQRAAWSELAPLSEIVLPRARNGLLLSSSLVTLYLLNERFDEAREVAQLWQRIPRDWIEDNLNKAHKSLRFLRKANGWWLGLWRSETRTPQEWGEVRRKARALGGDYVENYRNARVASALLKLSKAEDDEKLRLYIRSLKRSRSPVFAMPLDFDWELAQILGASRADFEKIVQDAERMPMRDKTKDHQRN